MTDSASQSLVDRNWEMLLRDIEPFSKKLIGSIRIDMNDVRSIQAAAARITELEAENSELRAADRDHLSAKAGMERRLTDRALAAESELSRVEVETIERCVNAIMDERLIDHTGEPDDSAYNMALEHVIESIRSLPPLAKRGDQESRERSNPPAEQSQTLPQQLTEN